jgi:hypothetical protein
LGVRLQPHTVKIKLFRNQIISLGWMEEDRKTQVEMVGGCT